MEGIKFTNELVKFVLRSYPKFKVKRWVYGERYIAIENEAGDIGLTHTDPIVLKVWRDPDKILNKLDEVEPTDLIMMLLHPNPAYKYISHAYINSLVNRYTLIEKDVGDPLSILYEDKDVRKIVIVGYIEPVIRKLIDRGYLVNIVEANLDMIGDDIRRDYKIYPWWSIEDLLVDSDALIITGSAIPNNTIGYILSISDDVRFKVVIGPSTTLAIEPFRRYSVNYLGGSIVIDGDRLFQFLGAGYGFHEIEKEGLIKKVTISLT